MKIVYSLSLISLITTTTSCQKKEILSQDEMVAVLHDIYLTESMYDVKHGSFHTDESKIALYNTVLKKHGITQAQLDSSLIWYSDNAQLFIRVSDSVISSLKKDVKQIDIEYANQKNTNYKTLEAIPSYFYLSYNQPILKINLDSIELQKFPNFELNFKTLGLTPKDSVLLSMSYVYKDTIVTQKQLLSENRSYDLKNTSDLPFQELKSILGYIYVEPSKIGDREILLNSMSIN